MADLMVHHHSLPELFLAMAERLRRVVAADAANFSLYDSSKNMMRLHLWQGHEISPVPVDVAVEASPSGWAWQRQEPLVVNDLDAESRFPLVLNRLRKEGLKSYCWLPLTTAEGKGNPANAARGQQHPGHDPRPAKVISGDFRFHSEDHST
jgi:formate hydrogenlyase transcriptional activator